jgi:hypothetical protein
MLGGIIYGFIYYVIMVKSVFAAFIFVGYSMGEFLEITEDEPKRVAAFILLIFLAVFFVKCVHFLLTQVGLA